MTLDLSQLAQPDIVETLDFEVIFQQRKERFIELAPDMASLMDYESEPAVKLLQEASYEDMRLRARMNDVARANLLAFATGTDLDQLAAFYGVARQTGEDDERLRRRVQLQIAALAGNGTAEQYRATAMAASPAVIDAAVMRPAIGSVALALWIADGADVAATLETVRTAFAADSARILGVPLTVQQAMPRPIGVTATLYREATAPVDLAQQLVASFPAALAAYAKLGRDVPRSWLQSRLHVAGVSRVELAAPAADVTLAPDEYATLGPLAIADGGVAW